MASAGARFGRYELLRPLGRGGMAEVFLARYVGPEGFEKRLVIKRVLPQLSDDRRLLRMFFEEARTQVSLSHGNLVAVFDFGRVGNEYFIAMEHVAGGDLATLVATERAAGRALSPAVVAHVGIELCRALAFVHRRGFVHRDLTPRNVLVSTDGEVKLSDFGVALAVASEAEPGLRGTLSYMAPEQARGDRVDGRADLFSLGLVLAEAVSGRRVRAGGGEEAALAEARAGAPVALEGPLAAVLARATATALDARFPSAEEMSTALEAELAALGVGRERASRDLAARLTTVAPPVEDVSTSASAAPAVTGTAGATAAATFNLRGRPSAAPTTAASAAETYFRDHRSATFVEEVLGVETPPDPPPRRRAAPWVALAIVGAGAAIGASIVATRPRATPPAPAVEEARVVRVAAAPDAAPPPAGVTAAAAPVVVAAPPPTRVAAGPVSPPRRRPVERRAAAAATGRLVIQCTPWCVPYVDGQARGKDGRSFVLATPTGPHAVEVRRLEDRQARDVRVRAGDEQLLKFTFD